MTGDRLKGESLRLGKVSGKIFVAYCLPIQLNSTYADLLFNLGKNALARFSSNGINEAAGLYHLFLAKFLNDVST